jgi:hypothetical protein
VISDLPIVRDPRTRVFFLVAAATSVATYYLSNLTSPLGLSSIFNYLFVRFDSWGAFGCVLILIAAAGIPRGFPAETMVLWLAEHPRTIACGTFVFLCAGTQLVYLDHPLTMDEYTQVFQSQVFAAGHLAGHFPAGLMDWLVPKGFQNYFLFVSPQTGAVASNYWPSFALLLTPFTFLGIPWACNPLISAATILVIHRLTLRIFGDPQVAGLAILLTIASPVFFASGISYYSMPAHLLANALFALLLTDPTPRRAFGAGVVGSIALTLHNPVPHMLFALPWLTWLATRAGGVRLLACAVAGYAPLCALLGLGWFWFTARLRQAGLDPNLAATAHLEHFERLGQAFAYPDRMVLKARLIGLAKIWVWAVPGLPLLGILGTWNSRGNILSRLLAYSALLTFIGYLFVPVDQGHGWGFRYFHSAWLALPILGAAALRDTQTRSFVVGCALLTLVFGTGLRAWQIHDFIADNLTQVPAYRGSERHVVILDPTNAYYGADLVQNDPWLRGPVIRMITRGKAEDETMMHADFPNMHKVFVDQHGAVWSAK